jgi:hypothetical protein
VTITAELKEFADGHRSYGSLLAQTGPLTPNGYRSHGPVSLWRHVRALDHPRGSGPGSRDTRTAQLMPDDSRRAALTAALGFLQFPAWVATTRPLARHAVGNRPRRCRVIETFWITLACDATSHTRPFRARIAFRRFRRGAPG